MQAGLARKGGWSSGSDKQLKERKTHNPKGNPGFESSPGRLVDVEDSRSGTGVVGYRIDEDQARSAERQSAGRNSVDGREVYLDPDSDSDLEDKPQPPPQVPSGTSVDLVSNRDPRTRQTKAISERYAFADSLIKPKSHPISTRRGKIEAKMTTTRKKMKAPDAEGEDQSSSTIDQWSIQAIETPSIRRCY
ncbi:unnamed protein product [Phytophthora fragariaefolia]|uniref:Unnamed protein product n=1 Tax=Phytophthora fragariaefolia TaxID=1490495 RepID=A0A9W6YNY3_9STRA|nr:unnamed protein product [Phytophthora fragariaefolia]